METLVIFVSILIASCRRLLIGSHHRPQQLASVSPLLQQICSGAPQRSVVTSSTLNKFNQPRLREENDHVTGETPALPIAVPSHPDHRAVEEPADNKRSHDCAVVSPAVDGVFHEPYPDPSASREEAEEEGEEERVETGMTLKKLSSIYLKLSKSRLSGNLYYYDVHYKQLCRLLLYAMEVVYWHWVGFVNTNMLV